MQNAWYLYIERPLLFPNILRTNVFVTHQNWGHHSSSYDCFRHKHSFVFKNRCKKRTPDRWINKHGSVKFLNCLSRSGKRLGHLYVKRGLNWNSSVYSWRDLLVGFYFSLSAAGLQTAPVPWNTDFNFSRMHACCSLTNWREEAAIVNVKN